MLDYWLGRNNFIIDGFAFIYAVPRPFFGNEFGGIDYKTQNSTFCVLCVKPTEVGAALEEGSFEGTWLHNPDRLDQWCRDCLESYMKATAPTRIDLAGGWTDVPLFANKYGGEVVGFAVTFRTSAEWQVNLQGHLEGRYSSSTPVGGGLGTTGSVNVAIIAAIDKGKSSPLEIAEKAFQYENILGNTGGRQDQYFAALGGFNHLLFGAEGVSQLPFAIDAGMKSWLHRQLFVFDTHIQHDSGALHDLIWEKFSSGDKVVIQALMHLKASAREMARSLTSSDRSKVADAMRRTCKALSGLHPGISSPYFDVLEPLYQAKYILCWKPVGAGAGGCVMMLVREGHELEVHDACNKVNWSRVSWDYDEQGVSVKAL